MSLATSLAQPIQRSQAEVSAFRAENPCPSTGLTKGPCPGYQRDHRDARCAGGADRAENYQWLTIEEHRWKTRSDVRMCRMHRRQ
ncbi:MAG: HNH endonuclease [Ramlibacter sp.]|nr:HNH endonuclease [Ramlibacter sp.]